MRSVGKFPDLTHRGYANLLCIVYGGTGGENTEWLVKRCECEDEKSVRTRVVEK
jgi:hypothetical protein